MGVRGGFERPVAVAARTRRREELGDVARRVLAREEDDVAGLHLGAQVVDPRALREAQLGDLLALQHAAINGVADTRFGRSFVLRGLEMEIVQEM